MNERDRAWVENLLTPQPVGVYLQPIRLTGAREAVPIQAYVRATRFASERFDRYYADAKEHGWRTYEVPGGHDVMIDEPDRLAAILLEIAAAAPRQ